MSPPLGIEPRTCRLTADRSANGALEASTTRQLCTRTGVERNPANQIMHPQADDKPRKRACINGRELYFFVDCGGGTKNSAVYSMRGTLQYRFTTARVQWPCSTDIHWAFLITQSGPARYVLNWRSCEYLNRLGLLTGLRVRGRAYRWVTTNDARSPWIVDNFLIQS